MNRRSIENKTRSKILPLSFLFFLNFKDSCSSKDTCSSSPSRMRNLISPGDFENHYHPRLALRLSNKPRRIDQSRMPKQKRGRSSFYLARSAFCGNSKPQRSWKNSKGRQPLSKCSPLAFDSCHLLIQPFLLSPHLRLAKFTRCIRISMHADGVDAPGLAMAIATWCVLME